VRPQDSAVQGRRLGRRIGGPQRLLDLADQVEGVGAAEGHVLVAAPRFGVAGDRERLVAGAGPAALKDLLQLDGLLAARRQPMWMRRRWV
jgi:hypothetical protein